ncbi:unnamed protein product [Prorocentrum cordatum]|uniref:Uncharacterized protein n=1 Tax=Prorocentrum cordatum TaxID=2364126 RepID=A0ABN9X1Y8_9DINO|nr:unnamed protein product [Polarella glacialis]
MDGSRFWAQARHFWSTGLQHAFQPLPAHRRAPLALSYASPRRVPSTRPRLLEMQADVCSSGPPRAWPSPRARCPLARPPRRAAARGAPRRGAQQPARGAAADAARGSARAEPARSARPSRTVADFADHLPSGVEDGPKGLSEEPISI